MKMDGVTYKPYSHTVDVSDFIGTPDAIQHYGLEDETDDAGEEIEQAEVVMAVLTSSL